MTPLRKAQYRSKNSFHERRLDRSNRVRTEPMKIGSAPH